MLGFFLLIGKQGEGKTLMATKLAFDESEDRPIFSNYKLFGRPYTAITFNPKLAKDEGKLDILAMLDIDPNYFNGGIMLLDEITLYLDSLDFMRKNNRRLQTFFSQLRKRNILLIGTTQYLMNLDIRIRRQCMAVLEMKHLKYDLFKVTTHEIDGYYTQKISEYFIDLKAYYDKFDTHEIIT
jgi:hypothetical protein